MKARFLTAAATLVLAGLGLAAAYPVLAGPDPAGPRAPAGEFSADRAFTHLQHVARAPHPAGSVESDTVRAYVTDQLRRLGLDPSESDAVEADQGDGWAHLAARPRNVVATIAGRAPTGRILLVAHTDSVETSHGASDDGLGVAGLLEIARALVSRPTNRNDVSLLFTDSEELGQLGARSFLRGEAAGAAGRTVVLNLEARGTDGRVVMFETGPGSASVIGSLADRPPVASSVSDEIYRLLPNTTDFTRFRTDGYAGLNFAVIGDNARYHTARDDLAEVDRGSLQDLGSTVLSATRSLDRRDLRGLAESGEATWFTLGPWLVRYPAGLVLPLGLAGLLAVLGASWFARRRGLVRPRAVALAAASFPLALIASGAVGRLAWVVLVRVKPAYGAFLYGAPYRQAVVATGLALVATAVTWIWLTRVERRAGPVEAATAALLWLGLLAAVTAALLPGASYLFTWAALAGAAGLATAARLPAGSARARVFLALPAVPLVLLLAPLLPVLLQTLGLGRIAAALVLIPLFASALLPLGPVSRRTATAGATALVLLGTTLVGVGAATDRTDADRPLPVGLMYTQDLDANRARWVSIDGRPDEWVRHYVGSGRGKVTEQVPNLWDPPGGFRVGPAPMTAMTRPAVRVLSSTTANGLRTLVLRVAPESGRPVLLGLYVDTSAAEVVSSTVTAVPAGGGTLPGGQNVPDGPSRWKWGLLMGGSGAEGFEVSLTVRATGPVPVLALAQDLAVPAAVLDRPLPPDRTWATEGSGLAYATRTYRL